MFEYRYAQTFKVTYQAYEMYKQISEQFDKTAEQKFEYVRLTKVQTCHRYGWIGTGNLWEPAWISKTYFLVLFSRKSLYRQIGFVAFFVVFKPGKDIFFSFIAFSINSWISSF